MFGTSAVGPKSHQYELPDKYQEERRNCEANDGLQEVEVLFKSYWNLSNTLECAIGRGG